MIAAERAAAFAVASTLLLAPEPLHYDLPQLSCARFEQTVRSDIETSLAGRQRREEAAMDGRLLLRAVSGGRDTLRIEAWFDSLTVWRRSAEGTLQPETDGIIGGRYRGVLAPRGRYRAEARPFVPDAVAEVADVSGVLDDLLPRLPPIPLAVGQVWSDSAGFEIRRLADSANAAGTALLRFRLTDRRELQEATVKGDSLPIPVRQLTRETGTFVWHPADGLTRRDRQVTVETFVPARGRVRQPVRSRLEQHIVLQRLSADGACPARSAAPDQTGAR
jgi:hypothetical protein